MKVNVVEYRTLSAFVSACHKNGIRIVKVTDVHWRDSSGWWRVGSRVTACSRKSPVLRIWDTKTERKSNVMDKVAIEGFYVIEGEWDKDELPSLMESLDERSRT